MNLLDPYIGIAQAIVYGVLLGTLLWLVLEVIPTWWRRRRLRAELAEHPIVTYFVEPPAEVVPVGCSECRDWFDNALNPSPVTAANPCCPIRGERCVRFPEGLTEAEQREMERWED